MKLSGCARVLTVGVCAALMLSMTGAAQAATIGWRPFFRQHYGTPTNFSGYRAVVALGRRDAWALGGTDLLEVGGDLR
jgi:hypothetical protein